MIISMAHTKGGVGKSTLSVMTAETMGADIMDLDLQRSCLFWNRTRKVAGHTPLIIHTPNNVDEAKVIMNEYKENGRTLIVDCGGFDSESNRIALNRSNCIITPVSPSQVELYGLQNFTKILKEASGVLKRDLTANVVINNADIRSQSAISDVQEFIRNNSKHLNLLESIIHCRSDFRKAYGAGMSVTEFNQKGKASEEIIALVDEIKSIYKIV